MHKYILSLYNSGVVVNYSTIEPNIFKNPTENVLVIDMQENVGGFIQTKQVLSTLELNYKQCLYPIIIYKPIRDHVYDTKQ